MNPNPDAGHRTEEKRARSNELERGSLELTNEVGDEGGSPGDIELERRPVVVTGSEATTTLEEIDETVERRRMTRGNRGTSK
jgi:hypothetical protein